MAITTCCCEGCARHAGAHGVKRIIYGWPYVKEDGIGVLKFYGIEVIRIIPATLNPYFDGVFNETPTN